MRVAIITPVYPPYRGGMGAVAAADVEALRASGLEVSVIVPKKRNFGNAAVMPQLLWQLRGFDFIHLHYPFYGSDIFAALASLFYHTPLIVTYHMAPSAKDYRGIIFHLHRIFLEPIILRLAKMILVSSFDYARAIGLRHPRMVERPLSVEVARFFPGRDLKIRERFQIPLDKRIVLFIGGLDTAHDFKGVDVLLQSMWQLSSSVPWNLVIVGEGDLRPVYEQLAMTLGISDRVRFLGNISDRDLPSIVREAQVHVLPSVAMNEAFGLVTLEAAASGVPSIVVDLPGVRTVVVPEETGLVVPPKDPDALAGALKRLLEDEVLCARLGQAARDRTLVLYSREKLAENLLPLYNSLRTV